MHFFIFEKYVFSVNIVLFFLPASESVYCYTELNKIKKNKNNQLVLSFSDCIGIIPSQMDL